jgi:twitching motility protein PilT
MLDLKSCLKEAITRGASDFHIVVGIPATLRIDGQLVMMPMEPVSSRTAKDTIYSILSEDHKHALEKNWELNFAYALPEIGRFRVNVYIAKGNVEAAFRVISVTPRTLEELGIPTVVAELSRKPDGLILITGPTGQGKTTTLAAMIHLINRSERRCRIVTIEDPVEYLHHNINSVVIQREVGMDTKSFNGALVQAMRQDPNVICIGEIRDLETIATALTAAETGHLVLATLHTPDAPQCIDRIVDVFPPHQQQQVRVQLASCLEGVVTQHLLPRMDGKGRVVAVEVLIATPAVRNLIRDRKTEQIYGVMQTGSTLGMIPLDSALKELYSKKVISYEVAAAKARDPNDIKSE